MSQIILFTCVVLFVPLYQFAKIQFQIQNLTFIDLTSEQSANRCHGCHIGTCIFGVDHNGIDTDKVLSIHKEKQMPCFCRLGAWWESDMKFSEKRFHLMGLKPKVYWLS